MERKRRHKAIKELLEIQGRGDKVEEVLRFLEKWRLKNAMAYNSMENRAFL